MSLLRRLLIAVAIFFALTLMCFAETIPVQTIAYEASGECFEAQVWVASVIITRARERSLTFEEVCLQPYQFSCWNKNMNLTPRTDRELQKARKAWNKALRDPYNVNMYHDTSVMPYWAASCECVKQIGKLVFYKE